MDQLCWFRVISTCSNIHQNCFLNQDNSPFSSVCSNWALDFHSSMHYSWFQNHSFSTFLLLFLFIFSSHKKKREEFLKEAERMVNPNWELKNCCQREQVAFLVTIGVFTLVILAVSCFFLLFDFFFITLFIHVTFLVWLAKKIFSWWDETSIFSWDSLILRRVYFKHYCDADCSFCFSCDFFPFSV